MRSGRGHGIGAGINLTRVQTLRWLSVGAMFLLIAAAPLLPTVEVPLRPLLTVAGLALSFNLVLLALRLKPPADMTPTLAVELVFDISAWAAFVYFSGGATNPLISILLPFVAIGAVVLPEAQAWAIGLLAILFYSLLWRFHLPLVVYNGETAAQLHLLGMWLTFAVSVLISVWFIARMTSAIRQRDLELSNAREVALRDQWMVSLGGLAAGTLHELGTPLSTLTTLVEEMRDIPQPASISQSDLALMESQLSLCRKALSRLGHQAGHPRAEALQRCNAQDWLASQGNAWRSLHPRNTVSIEIAPELRTLQVLPDLALEQAIRNLVDNAAAACPGGTVAVSAGCRDDHLEIGIVDRGPGIDPGIIRRLELGLPQESQHGMGIGLALTKSAIERYQGSITFDNSPDRGVEVTISIPLSRIGLS